MVKNVCAPYLIPYSVSFQLGPKWREALQRDVHVYRPQFIIGSV